MPEVTRTTRKQSLKMAGVIASSAIGMNSAFWLLSGFYYDDKPQLGVDIGSVRLAFALLTLLVAAMSYLAAFAPRLVGHGIGFVAGIASFVAGIGALASTIPHVVGVSLLLIGLVLPVVTWKSLNHSRVAWAILASILAVLATLTFFGAPKIRHVLGIGLWYALIIPALEVVAVIALAMVRGEYGPSAKRPTSAAA